MDEKKDVTPSYGTAAVILLLVFASALAAGWLFLKRGRHPRAPADPRIERLAAAIKTHPDPTVGRDFIGGDGMPGVRMEVATLADDDGQFAVVDGRPILDIRTSILDEAVSAQGLQKLWGVLSHEHEHYRQWLEGESVAYMSAARPFSETRCTMSVTLEVGAYAKSCRDAQLYGWDNVRYQCDAISLKTIAQEKLAHELARFPECEPVWRLFAEGRPAETPQASAPPPLRPEAPPAGRTPSPVRGATYLAPP
jgi:hypothetical protein